MKPNMGVADRFVRLLVAAVIAILYFNKTITGTTATILIIIAGVFIATSLVSFCPLYKLVGISTCKRKSVK